MRAGGKGTSVRISSSGVCTGGARNVYRWDGRVSGTRGGKAGV